ncbi:TIGR02757 family protein [bacterium]|nr:TIGR02757 family protein [bacterium]
MNDPAALKACLDSLAADYDARFLDSDPVGLVHRYRFHEDIETAGFIVSVLAFGNAVQIRKSAETVLAYAGDSPARFARGLTPKSALEVFSNFKHRWTTGSDIAFLFFTLGRIVEEEGSLEALVRKLDNPGEKTIEELMARLSRWFVFRYTEDFGKNPGRPGISYLVPSPAGGSACKRLALFFRWMVRGPDGVDFGLWKFINSSRLVIPLDRHIARMAALLGLSSRRIQDWKMAIEITESLRQLDPDDPVRYDFALVRPGILRKCTAAKQGDCPECSLHNICTGRWL